MVGVLVPDYQVSTQENVNKPARLYNIGAKPKNIQRVICAAQRCALPTTHLRNFCSLDSGVNVYRREANHVLRAAPAPAKQNNRPYRGDDLFRDVHEIQLHPCRLPRRKYYGSHH
jgi:hypothetical protein